MTRSSRQTRQKKVLEREMQAMDSFFTAEDLHHKVRRRDPRIGIATVYRFLKSDRNIHPYVCDRKTLYSSSSNSHCHFVCKGCGTKELIQVDNLGFIKDKLDGSVCHFQIEIEGMCRNCLGKENSQRAGKRHAHL